MLIALLALYALLAAADITTTIIALRGGDTEGNGAMAWLFARLGAIPTMLVLKGGILALTVYAVPRAFLEHPWIMWGPLVPAAVHAYCVVNNIRCISDN